MKGAQWNRRKRSKVNNRRVGLTRRLFTFFGLGVSSALHVRLSIKKESRDLYVQWVFYVGSLISISNHNIHRDVGVASFSTGLGNGWILTAPVELGVMEYKQEDIRGELDGIKPSSLYERTTHSPIMCRAYQITE
jgi:hypothetical protein